MAWTLEHIKAIDGRIQKTFGKSVQRAAADFHFADRSRVQDEFKAVYPDSPFPDAFVDPRSRPYQVWISDDLKDEGTIVHETVHLYGMWYRQTFPDTYGININEGVTEFFTRQVAAVRRGSYVAEHEEVAALVKFMKNEEPLRSAFFQGCFSTWQGAVGPRTFIAWQQQMRAAQWSEARKVLNKPPDKPTTVACRAQRAP